MRHSLSFAASWAALLAFGALQEPAAAFEKPQTASETTLRSPGAYQFLLGDFRVVALTDGTVSVPLGRLLHGTADVAGDFRAVGQTPDRPTSINVFLIDTGERRLLIDAGAGDLFGDCCGRLPEILAAAGYPVETIDAVLLTHVHGDHSGGLTRGGVRVFPNADLYLSRRELDYWTSDMERARVEPQDRASFDKGRASLAPYQAAGRVRALDDGAELFAGVRAVPAQGHTPGHVFYEIESRGSRLRVIGDLIHAVEVQLADPSVTIDYDVDEPRAAATRQAELAHLADERILTAAPHISFPGLGHVYRREQGYAWSPLPYAYAVRQEGRAD